jgi:hypothetical protein
MAQRDGAAAAAVVGAVAGVAAAAAANEALKERMELFATNYVLDTYGYEGFRLELDRTGGASRDFQPGAVSVLVFYLSQLDPEYGNELGETRQALVAFMDDGWVNEFGIDFTKVQFQTFNKDQWNKFLSAYVELASGQEVIDGKVPVFEENYNKNAVGEKLLIGDYVYVSTGAFSSIKYSEFTNRGLKNRNKIILPFRELDGDSYLVRDFSDTYKIIYNEKSLGIYLKDLRRLVQIKRNVVERISKFVNY